MAGAGGGSFIPILGADEEGAVEAILSADEGSDDATNLQAPIDASGVSATLPRDLQVVWMSFFEARRKAPMMPTFDASSDSALIGIIKPLDMQTASFAWYFCMQSGAASGETQLYLTLGAPCARRPRRCACRSPEKGKSKYLGKGTQPADGGAERGDGAAAAAHNGAHRHATLPLARVRCGQPRARARQHPGAARHQAGDDLRVRHGHHEHQSRHPQSGPAAPPALDRLLSATRSRARRSST